MKGATLGLLLSVSLVCAPWVARSAPAEPSTSPSPKKSEKKAPPASSSSAKTPETKAGDKSSPAPLSKFMGEGASNGPTTTEIFADEAFFDSSKSMGIFSGHVKVVDPRFNLQSDKLTVYISKGENQGLEKAVAEGNVGVVRDRPDPNGGPPTRAVGRSDTATYVSATGDVELKGTPRVQQGENTHIATSPDTVMIINQSGQLTTHGPSRTDIRQQPKEGDDGGKAADKSPSPGSNEAKPKGKGQAKADKPKSSPKP
jgi:lipopolysaccharide transport protein LptA